MDGFQTQQISENKPLYHEPLRVLSEADTDLITDEQVLTIEAFILDNELPIEPVMQYLKSKGHDKFSELPAKSFDQFMATLKRSAVAKVRG